MAHRQSTTAHFGIRLRKTGRKNDLVNGNDDDTMNHELERYPVTRLLKDSEDTEEDGAYSLNVLSNKKKIQVVLDIPFGDLEHIHETKDKDSGDIKYDFKLFCP